MTGQTELRQTRMIWSPGRAYAAAGFCFALGLCFGYVMHSVPQNAAPPAASTSSASAQGLLFSPSATPRLPLQNPPEVAAKAASTVLEQLKSGPNNFDLLRQAGNIYMYSRVFSGAAAYYKRALDQRNDLKVRNDYANALFYSGDADAALQQHQEILKSDPANDSALFNRGLVLWEGKNDPQGAIESWKTLLKVHPDHPQRSRIEEMIAQASEHAQPAP
ncbi:MAG TPA: tetratricopeptide repeat protein [Terriglobales bacterium]|nr:tetratricopeptide repeat protein [Terriglobales bacterium]